VATTVRSEKLQAREHGLLIRRSMEGVRSVCRNPYPQVRILSGVRQRRHSPVPSGQFVRNCERLLSLAAREPQPH
jgi:hypothetical protein